MKTVFTNRMVAHVWAQQTQSHGRSGSMRFDGPTIYSYSTAIATIYAKENLALINSRTYSMTTSSKHMPAVNSALSIPYVKVPNVRPNSSTEHRENLDYLILEYADYGQKLRRARDVGEWQYARIDELAANVRLYALAFKMRKPHIDPSHDANELRAFRAAREKRLNTPANAAKRARLRETRVERAAAAAYRKEEKRRAELAEHIAKWRAYRTAEYYTLRGLPYALCRLSRDGQTVQTSQGAEVPVEDARRAVEFIAACRAANRAWVANGQRLPVGQFQVNSIDSTGDIRAGCHQIEWREIAHLAGLLNIAVGA